MFGFAKNIQLWSEIDWCFSADRTIEKVAINDPLLLEVVHVVNCYRSHIPFPLPLLLVLLTSPNIFAMLV